MSFVSTDRARFPLRTRILAATIATLLLAMIAAFIWSAVNLRSILDTRNDRFLSQKIAELTSALRDQNSVHRPEALTSELRREIDAHTDLGLFAILWRDGVPDLFPANDAMGAIERLLRSIDPEQRRRMLTIRRENSRIRIVRSQPQNVDGVSWEIEIGMSLDETDAALADFYRRLALGGIAFLALAVAGGMVLTRLSVRPIAEAIDAARRLNPSDLSARLPSGQSNDELDQLAVTINTLLDRVEQSQLQMTRFTSDASHELRGPLAALRTAIEISLQQPRSEDGYRELLGALGEQCQRLTDLVNNLLLLARADAGQVPVQQENVDLPRLVRESVELFQPLADERQLELRCELNGAVQVQGDSLRLRQLISNLLDNAIKFSNTRGLIRINLSSNARHVQLIVTDTGIGMNPECLPHIFDRFYRIDPSRAGAGTGLGLSICQWIVLAHRGTIAATSARGEGTTVTIQLPIGQARSNHLPVLQNPESVSWRNSPAT